MKKTRILLICTVVMAFACIFVVAGCSKTEKISSIELKDIAPETAIEFQVGRFDYSEYSLAVKYDSGSVVEVALSEDMISELDRLKFYQPGDHTITISHGGKSCELKISVKRDTFGELKFPEDNVFTYDGSEHKVEIVGELPSNASVTYIGGNSFVNAGTYDVTAVVTCSGYVTERITTTVTIERAKYDVSNIKFESKEFVYDGKPHSIEISGQLPYGVAAPTYYINGSKTNSAVDADRYSVTAVFSNNDPNYDTIPTMEATLNILPAEYSLGDVEIIFKDEKGSAYMFPWKSYDGDMVSVEVADGGTLKNKVSLSYTVYDENDNVISVSNADTKIKNAGVYTVKVNFTLLDSKNYKEIEPLVCEFEIFQAKLDISEMGFESKVVEYNGELQSLFLSIPGDLDVTKFDISYNYYYFGKDVAIKGENGEPVTGVLDAGEYTVEAVFTVKDSNYKDIDPMEAKLVIKKKQVPVSGFGLYNTNLTYNGNAQVPFIYQNIMKKYVCDGCGWKYDEETGDNGLQIAPGTKFDTLPDDFKCPVCHEAYFFEDYYLNISKISVSKVSGNGYFGVDEAVDAGSYVGSFTVSVIDEKNYVFDNGETSIDVVGGFTIRARVINISSLGFVGENPASVGAGDGVAFTFDTKNVANLTFKAEFFRKMENGTLSNAIEPASVTYDNGVMSVALDSFGLDGGDYICRITVSAENGNYVLSNGNATAEYDFEFKIAG